MKPGKDGEMYKKGSEAWTIQQFKLKQVKPKLVSLALAARRHAFARLTPL